MENMGELVEQRDLEEPLPVEGVDSPVANAQAAERRERISPEHAVIVSVRSERAPCKDDDQEVLSVIVSPRADSRDSELLSPSKLSPTSASMIDASEFRMQPEPTYQTLTSMVDRGISPAGLSPNSSYATLTPLQPLPPISTVSDKFAYGHAGSVSGSFTVMQNNLGLGYGYEKMGVSPHYSTPALGLGIPPSPLSPQSPYSQGLQSPQKSMSPTGYESPNYHRALTGPQSPALSPPSASLHSPVNATIQFGGTPASLNGISSMTPHSTPMSPQHSPTIGVQREIVESPSPPSVIHRPPSQGKTMQNEMAVNVVLNTPATSEVEEINTKELAQRISAELKRYSIPQAIFAQRVLCRSQGTLSDLLRNPKPWSKLKSGRETFRRMWKWLQEPEFQRMSALRLADCQMRSVNVRAVNAKRRKPTSSSCLWLGRRFGCFPEGLEEVSAHGRKNGSWRCLKEIWICLNLHPAAQIPQRGIVVGVKRREETATGASQQITADHNSAPKKPRLVFTDLQRRTLQAIFKETKRPSKEMQVTIARQLGLEPTTVGNFFMNARRRSMDKWRDEEPGKEESPSSSANVTTTVSSGIQQSTVLQNTGTGHEEL